MMCVLLNLVIDYYCIDVIRPNLQHRFILISCTNQCHYLEYCVYYRVQSEDTQRKI